MDERRAKYCDVASLKFVLWVSRELFVVVDVGSSDLALVRAWIASPAELINFATSWKCSNALALVYTGSSFVSVQGFLSYRVYIVQLSNPVSRCEYLVRLTRLLVVLHNQKQ